MAVSGGKVHQPAFCNDVDAFSVLKGIGLYVGPCGGVAHGHCAELCHGNLHVKMPGVAADGPVLHSKEVFRADNILAAGDCDKDVSKGCGFHHGHNLEAVHHGLHGLDGVYFRDNHAGTLAFCAHCNALAAPAVAGHNHVLSGHNQVGGAVDAVPHALAGAVTVVKEVLAVCVVHQHHGETEFSGGVHCLQAQDAGGCFLAAAYDPGDKLREFVVDGGYKVSAIVYDDIGAGR